MGYVIDDPGFIQNESAFVVYATTRGIATMTGSTGTNSSDLTGTARRTGLAIISREKATVTVTTFATVSTSATCAADAVAAYGITTYGSVTIYSRVYQGQGTAARVEYATSIGISSIGISTCTRQPDRRGRCWRLTALLIG